MRPPLKWLLPYYSLREVSHKSITVPNLCLAMSIEEALTKLGDKPYQVDGPMILEMYLARKAEQRVKTMLLITFEHSQIGGRRL